MITKNSIIAKALNAMGGNVVGTRWVAKDDPLFIVRVLSESSGKVRVQSADGGTCTYSADEFKREYKLANARSRNAKFEAGDNVAANVRNSKFKVGDEVRVGNPHLADRGRYGRVVSAGVDGNPLLYDVDLGGGVQLFSESDLVAANSRSRNAVVQKALNAMGGNVVGTRWVAKDDPLFIVRVLSESSGKVRVQSADGGTCTYSADEFKREYKLANARSRNAKFEVGDKVRVWQYPIRGQYGKVVKVGLMEYDVEVDGKVYPGIDYRRVVKMPASKRIPLH